VPNAIASAVLESGAGRHAAELRELWTVVVLRSRSGHYPGVVISRGLADCGKSRPEGDLLVDILKSYGGLPRISCGDCWRWRTSCGPGQPGPHTRTCFGATCRKSGSPVVFGHVRFGERGAPIQFYRVLLGHKLRRDSTPTGSFSPPDALATFSVAVEPAAIPAGCTCA
jgi:hypothetical protein